MIRVFLLFLRRLWLPLVVFAGFSLMCVLVYRHLEGLRWQDALFWMIQPHAIDYQKVRNATKFFSLFVFVGVSLRLPDLGGRARAHHYLQPSECGGLENHG